MEEGAGPGWGRRGSLTHPPCVHSAPSPSLWRPGTGTTTPPRMVSQPLGVPRGLPAGTHVAGLLGRRACGREPPPPCGLCGPLLAWPPGCATALGMCLCCPCSDGGGLRPCLGPAPGPPQLSCDLLLIPRPRAGLLGPSRGSVGWVTAESALWLRGPLSALVKGLVGLPGGSAAGWPALHGVRRACGDGQRFPADR